MVPYLHIADKCIWVFKESILKAFNKTNVFFAAFLKSLKIVNIAGENVAFIFHRKNVDTATLHLHQVRGG